MRALFTVFWLSLALAVPALAGATKFFHSPTGNIECEVSGGSHGKAYCQTTSPAASVTLHANGHISKCHGAKCLGNGPENASKLGYGSAITVSPFRCFSRSAGMNCLVTKNGHGFIISAQGIKTQ